MTLPAPALVYVAEKVEAGLRILAIEAHAAEVAALPFHHHDPFDRLIVAQARLEGLTLVTRDPVFRKDGANVVW